MIRQVPSGGLSPAGRVAAYRDDRFVATPISIILSWVRAESLYSLHKPWFVVLAIVLMPLGVDAQDWKPTKTVEIVAGSSPGGALDRTARQIQSILQAQNLVPTPVFVSNRPGAGSAIAWSYLNRRPPDGASLSVTIPGLITNRLTGLSELTYRDFTPIAILSSEYVIFAVPTSSSIKIGSGLIDVLKKDPGSLNIGIATALGGANHIAVAQAMKAAGVDVQKLTFVVYASSGEALTALLGKHIDMVASSAANLLPALQTSRIRPIAITSPQRQAGVLKDIPTWKEQGINMIFASWRGVIGPKDMTAEQIKYWDDVFGKLVKTPEWKQSVERNLEQETYLNSEQTKGFLEQEDRSLTATLNQLGIAK